MDWGALTQERDHHGGDCFATWNKVAVTIYVPGTGGGTPRSTVFEANLSAQFTLAVAAISSASVAIAPDYAVPPAFQAGSEKNSYTAHERIDESEPARRHGQIHRVEIFNFTGTRIRRVWIGAPHLEHAANRGDKKGHEREKLAGPPALADHRAKKSRKHRAQKRHAERQ